MLQKLPGHTHYCHLAFVCMRLQGFVIEITNLSGLATEANNMVLLLYKQRLPLPPSQAIFLIHHLRTCKSF